MTEFTLSYFCHSCGHRNEAKIDAPLSPKMNSVDVECQKCKDKTHVLATACPRCKESFSYFLSDLDFFAELGRVGDAYVQLIDSIRKSLVGIVQEFSVPLPKRWSARFKCECGKEYASELALPQLKQA